jgi:hypothetical protein
VRTWLKRAAVVVAAKKAFDMYQESRRPRPSAVARFGVPAVLVAAGGAIAYLGATGKLQGIPDQIRKATGSSEQPPEPPVAPTTTGPVAPTT